MKENEKNYYIELKTRQLKRRGNNSESAAHFWNIFRTAQSWSGSVKNYKIYFLLLKKWVCKCTHSAQKKSLLDLFQLNYTFPLSTSHVKFLPFHHNFANILKSLMFLSKTGFRSFSAGIHSVREPPRTKIKFSNEHTKSIPMISMARV